MDAGWRRSSLFVMALILRLGVAARQREPRACCGGVYVDEGKRENHLLKVATGVPG